LDIRRTSLAILLAVCLALSGPASIVAASGEIVIDGYYDDWEDKPHAEVYKGNNPQPKHINLVGMFRDDDRLCVHIVFAEQYSSGIKNMEVEVETNLGSAVFELDENPAYDKNITLIEKPLIDNGDLDESSNQLELRDPEQGGNQDPELDPEQGLEPNGHGGAEPAPETSVRHLLMRLGARLFVYAEGEEDALPYDGEGDTGNDGAADSLQEDAGKIDGSEEGGESGEPEEPENGEDEPGGEADGDDEHSEVEPSLKPTAKPQPPAEVIREFIVKLDGDPVGTGYMTIVDKTVVEAEFCIPLYTINAQADGIADIRMQINKLGKQWLYWSGVGSGPYIGIAVSLMAGLGLGVYLHRKKRVGTEVEE
jgi:hypothetical protein